MDFRESCCTGRLRACIYAGSEQGGYSFYPRVVSIKSFMGLVDGTEIASIAIAERIVATMNYCRGKSLLELQAEVP